jgi:hypothetical protein
MTFKRVAPNSHYRELRLLSERGHWEFGMSAYSHGMRMRMGRAGQPPRLMDFCMGRDASLFPQVLVAVLQRLERLAESASVEAIDTVFPWAGTRPELSIHLTELLDSERKMESNAACLGCSSAVPARRTTDHIVV